MKERGFFNIAMEDSGEQSEKTDKYNDARFDFNVTSEELSKFMVGKIPANMKKSTMWAVRNFEEWQKSIERCCSFSVYFGLV